MKQGLEPLKDSDAAIMMFDLWLDAIIKCDDFPDCRRFDDEFLEWSGMDHNSPFHLMFIAFVGAIDLIDFSFARRDVENE